MDTRTKLEEAGYFLRALIKTENKPRDFVYNLSAFLSAWKSVLDVMLYDLAEHYSIGLTREDRMTDYEFEIAAKTQNKTHATQFLKWWRKKVGVLSKNPLWNLRHIMIHRGYPPMKLRLYLPPSISSSAIAFRISPAKDFLIPVKVTHHTTREFKLSEVLDGCKKAFNLMYSIVDEAEREFKIQL